MIIVRPDNVNSKKPCFFSGGLFIIGLLMSLMALGNDEATDGTMSWPLLPGESVLQLSRAFYPDNVPMQRLFVKRTLALSQPLLPALEAETGYLQTTTIIIPNIQTLAEKPATTPTTTKTHRASIKMSYRIASEKLEQITPEMEQEYAWLTMRNARLKIQLNELLQRVDVLEKRLAELQAQTQDWLTRVDNETKRANILPVAPLSVEAIPTNTVAAPDSTAIQTSASASQSLTPPSPNSVNSESTSASTPTATSAYAEDGMDWMSYQFWLMVTLVLMLCVILARIVMRLRIRAALTSRMTPHAWDPTDPNTIEESTYSTEDDAYDPMLVEEMPVQSNVGLLDQTTISNAEMDFAVDKAQALLDERKVQQAIELLNSAINAQPKAALRPWLSLLEIYRQLDEKEDFMNLAKRFQQNYNVRMPQWEPISYSMVVEDSLERFPHVSETLQSLWEQVDLFPDKVDVFLDELILDNRQGEREGFYILVLQEIMLLKDVLAMRAKL